MEMLPTAKYQAQWFDVDQGQWGSKSVHLFGRVRSCQWQQVCQQKIRIEDSQGMIFFCIRCIIHLWIIPAEHASCKHLNAVTKSWNLFGLGAAFSMEMLPTAKYQAQWFDVDPGQWGSKSVHLFGRVRSCQWQQVCQQKIRIEDSQGMIFFCIRCIIHLWIIPAEHASCKHLNAVTKSWNLFGLGAAFSMEMLPTAKYQAQWFDVDPGQWGFKSIHLFGRVPSCQWQKKC